MKLIKFYYLLLVVFLAACKQTPITRIDLSGDWKFATDQNDIGEVEQWFLSSLEETVSLPGSMKENDKGDIPELSTPWTGSIYDSSFYFNPNLEKFRQKNDVKFPFWLTPDKYYKGAAWYQKEIEIPKDWGGQRVILHLERPHWQTKVWINDELIGTQNSLSTPHEFNLTNKLNLGGNTITVCVDNRTDSIDVGPDSHSVSDHTQGNWNGIVGDIYLQAGSPLYIDDVQLYPDVKDKTVKAVVSIKNVTGQHVDAEINLRTESISGESILLPSIKETVLISGKEKLLEIEYDMGEDVLLWDEFHPNLYQMTASIHASGSQIDEKKTAFGMREIVAENGKILINGRPVFMRGTLECNVFPLTGYPPTDVDSWKDVFMVCKESGLNHIRFHSHCPPEAAFVAADEIGIYLQPEAASWPNHGTSLGDGRLTDQYILDETERIIKAYGNHPSFVMWAYCNEPYGNYVPFLDKSLINWKKKDKRRIYTAASIARSWRVNPESEFIVRSNPRGLPFKQQPNSLFNYEERIADEKRPYVTHEMGQYCVFPDFDEIDEYTGVYKAKNFEMFREILADNNMREQAQEFLMASGKLQALCYKAEIEAQLRTETLDGFQLLGLSDFSGQGSAIIGLLNAFWQEKGYISKNEISRFCNQTVPLAEFQKFVFNNQENLKCSVQVSHYGPNDMENIQASYRIISLKGDTITSGKLPEVNIPTGQLSTLGTIHFQLKKISQATQCKLVISVGQFENDWDFWVFPSSHPKIEENEVIYTDNLDSAVLDKLKNGAKVFLDASGKIENGKDIVANFTPVFWNTSWFKMRPPHTTGILVQNAHAAFNEFPTSYHSNYHWWEIVNRQQVMCIDSFPPDFKPLVQPIDTWFLSRRLAQLFEARVGKGKLVVSTLNLNENNGLASAQLKQSLLKYMNSNSFKPKEELAPEHIQELFEKKNRQQINLYTVGTPDELKPDYKKTKK